MATALTAHLAVASLLLVLLQYAAYDLGAPATVLRVSAANADAELTSEYASHPLLDEHGIPGYGWPLRTICDASRQLADARSKIRLAIVLTFGANVACACFVLVVDRSRGLVCLLLVIGSCLVSAPLLFMG